MTVKPTYNELEKRVQELEQTKYDHELMDEKLRESEERFRTVIEQSPSAIEIYEPNGKLLIVNNAWNSFWDMKKRDMVNFNIFNDPEYERTGLTSAFKKVLQNIECSIPPSKYDLKESGFPEGSIRWINSKMYPIKDQYGKIKNIVLVLEDITAQKNAEEVLRKNHNEIELKIQERIAERVEELKEQIEDFTECKHIEKALLESENQYRILTENIKDVVWVIDFESMSFRYISPSVEKLRGYTPEEIIAQPVIQALTLEAGSHLIELIRIRAKAFQTGKTTSDKYYIDEVEQPCKDGSTVWTEVVHSYYINPENNKIEIRGVTRDITERKQMVEALRESEEKFRSLVGNIPGISYRCRNDEFWTMEIISDEVKILTGYPASDFLQNAVRSWSSIIHPEDKEAAEEHAIEKINRKEPYTIEFRIIGADGDIRWCLEKGQGVFDEQGKLCFLDGVIVDHTKLKQAEKGLHYSKLQLEAVLNNIDASVYITDMQSYEILYMNTHMKDLFGKDLIGHICWKSIYENKDGPCDFCTNDKLIDVNGYPKEPYVWENYNNILKKWYQLHDQAIPWIDGKLVRMDIAVDITQRKKAEEQIAASLKEKIVLLREIHHRVKNNMQVILSLLRMHGRRTKSANLGKVFEDCRDRINAMSLIHESLYQSEDLAKIDFKDYLEKLCRNLSQAYGASGRGISLAVGECDVALDMDQGIAIGMVIAELVSNAFKHAFPAGKGGNVSINLSELDVEHVKLMIKDDGKGMPPEIDIMNSPSLGLQLAVSAVTLELGGSIELDREKGTQFTICFEYKRK